MVKNGPNSLRGSVSTLSLRNRVEEDNERALRDRITELEAQLAASQARMAPGNSKWEEGVELMRRAITSGETMRVNAPAPYMNSMGVGAAYHSQDALEAGEMRQAAQAEEMQEMVQRCKRNAHEKLKKLRHMSNGQPSLDETLRLDAHFKSLFEKFHEGRQLGGKSLISTGIKSEGSTLKSPEAYCQPFCDFLTENPTVFHAVDYFEKKLEKAGFKKVGIALELLHLC